MTVTNVFCLFLIGDLTDTFVFPVMIAARYITIADFLQHIESLIIAIWIFGIFVKISVFLYISVTSTAEWFGMRNYKPLVWPLSLLSLVFSYWVATGGSGLSSLITASANLYTISVLLVLPGLTYGLAWLKKGWSHVRKNRRVTDQMMRIVRTWRMLIAFISLLSCVVLGGCWDRIEINDLAIVLATGVDYENDKVHLTAQIFVPRKAGGGDSTGVAEVPVE